MIFSPLPLRAWLYAGLMAAVLALAGWLFTSRAVALKSAQEARNQAALYKGSLESLQAAVEARTKSDNLARAVLKKRAEVAEARAAQARKESRDLQQALDASRDWASSPIPDSVRESLSH